MGDTAIHECSDLTTALNNSTFIETASMSDQTNIMTAQQVQSATVSLRDILTSSMITRKIQDNAQPEVDGNSAIASRFPNNQSNKNNTGLTPNKRMKTTNKEQPKRQPYDPLLPPCKVCGAKASGIHFGAITCEACKVFFRRSMLRKSSYYCKNGGNCEMFPMRRITCSYCRLKKCTELGMSRDGIQRGRYTVERKTECIKKAKELEITHQSRDNREHQNGNPHNNFEPSIHSPIPTDSELDKLREDVIKSDFEHLMIDEDYMKKLLDIQAKFLEYRKIKESMFGPIETLPVEEYLQVYRNTGIDLGNRREKFATCMINFVPKLTKFIEYVKSLPGFLELPPSDQITLSKESAADWIILSGYQMFNAEARVFTCCTCHHTWPYESMKNSRFSIQGYLASSVMKKLKLSNDELAILKALAIFSPDGSEGQIDDKSTVKKYQYQLTESLLATLRTNRQLDDSKLAIFFGQIVHALTEVKDASISFKELMDKSLLLFPDVDYPDLVVEMFSDAIKLDTARSSLSQISLQNSPEGSSSSLSDNMLSAQSPSSSLSDTMLSAQSPSSSLSDTMLSAQSPSSSLSDTMLSAESQSNLEIAGEFVSLLPSEVPLPPELTDDLPTLFPYVTVDVHQVEPLLDCLIDNPTDYSGYSIDP